jgi:hypothetical protein
MLQRTLGDPAERQAEQLQEWREASKQVMRTYDAWCATSRRDRHMSKPMQAIADAERAG